MLNTRSLQAIHPLRKAFHKEMNTLESLNDFQKKLSINEVVKVIKYDSSYVLGKFTELELENENIPAFYLAELYTPTKSRLLGKATKLLEEISEICKLNDLPIILGCDESLIPFYFKRGFSMANYDKLTHVATMLKVNSNFIKKDTSKFIKIYEWLQN